MNKIIPALTSVLLLGATLSNAATGFFGNTFVVANSDTFYEITDNTAETQLSDGFGSLDTTVSTTFNIQGFEFSTFEDNNSEITHMNMFWTIDDFATTNQIEISPAPVKDINDRFWQITTATQNLLDNNGGGALSNGAYTFQAYFEGYTNNVDTPGNIFLNNGGSNYSAGFTVIPEPSSILMLGLTGAAAGMIALLKRRKRA